MLWGNTAYGVTLSGDDLSRYSNKIESVGLRKCPCYHYILPRKWCHGNIHFPGLAVGVVAGKRLAQIWCEEITSPSPCVCWFVVNYCSKSGPTQALRPIHPRNGGCYGSQTWHWFDYEATAHMTWVWSQP